MKIYTKTGDDGSTGLFGGARVSKDDLRVEAYGAADELNTCLGMARAALRDEPADDRRQALDRILERLQEDLFVLGADLASPRGDAKPASYLPRLETAAVVRLEGWIDEHDGQIPALQNFILPGGSRCGSTLHHARAVCRRAERAAVTLARQTPLGPEPVQYLNRLGDLLFVLARYANSLSGVAETEWAPRRDRATD
jgi:cob(I)alamin adenosyltransferase